MERRISFRQGAWAANATAWLALLGLVCAAFTAFFNVHVLNPHDYGWLLGGDWLWHFVGWTAYCHEPWSWPPGSLHSLGAPLGSSVVYTDSLPLLAMPLKWLVGCQSGAYQFIGIWFLCCLLLQGSVGYLVARRLTGSRLLGLGGAALLLLYPPLYQRLGHDTLFAQWLVLAGLGIAALADRKKAYLVLTALLLIALLVQAYFVGMLLIIAGARLVGEFLLHCRHVFASDTGDKGRMLASWLFRAAGWVGLAAFLCAVEMYLAGYFEVPLGDSQGYGLGIYQMNLNALVNPHTQFWSRFLPPLPEHTRGFQEGFQYLGVGVLWCLLVAIVAQFRMRKDTPERHARFRMVIVAAVIAFLFALSPVWVLGDSVLVHWPLPAVVHDLWSVFRATGRFSWIVGLTLILWALWRLGRMPDRKLAIASLTLGVALQMVDLSGATHLLQWWTMPHVKLQARYEQLSAAWPASLNEVKFYPALVPLHYISQQKLLRINFAAVTNGATSNAMYFARLNIPATRREGRKVVEKLRHAQSTPHTMYVVDRSSLAACDAAAQKHASLLGEHAVLVHGGWLSRKPLPPAWQNASFHRAVDRTVAGAVHACGPGCNLLLGVRDEGSKNLSAAAVAALEARGAIRIAHLGYRNSYLAVIAHGHVVAEALSNHGPVHWSGRVDGRRVTVASAGAPFGNYARLQVGGFNCSINKRGFNGLMWKAGTDDYTAFHQDTYE